MSIMCLMWRYVIPINVETLLVICGVELLSDIQVFKHKFSLNICEVYFSIGFTSHLKVFTSYILCTFTVWDIYYWKLPVFMKVHISTSETSNHFELDIFHFIRNAVRGEIFLKFKTEKKGKKRKTCKYM